MDKIQSTVTTITADRRNLADLYRQVCDEAQFFRNQITQVNDKKKDKGEKMDFNELNLQWIKKRKQIRSILFFPSFHLIV